MEVKINHPPLCGYKKKYLKTLQILQFKKIPTHYNEQVTSLNTVELRINNIIDRDNDDDHDDHGEIHDHVARNRKEGKERDL